MKIKANWITTGKDYEKGSAVVFYKKLSLKKAVKKATLNMTALGVYEAKIDGKRVSDYVLAPGWTQYLERHQVQTYDVTNMLSKNSLIEVTVGDGWIRGRINHFVPGKVVAPVAIIGDLIVEYKDGTSEIIETDETWMTKASKISMADIYDGETYDANFVDKNPVPCKKAKWTKKTLIAQEGEIIKEKERLKPILIKAPNGEKLLDFGQNMTGFVEFTVNAKKGEKVIFDCAEILDKDGNFYRENYRSAKTRIEYTCHEGENTYKPSLTFLGFRYIRIIKHPRGKIDPMAFTGIAVYSDIKRTGYLESSNKKLNRLFENVFWGQKDNYLDIPTDCPQRDERWGWTGDAQVFARTASFNYDVEKFFRKWLRDVTASSGENGAIGKIVPFDWSNCVEGYKENILGSGAGWGDAATICPWEMYLTYGNIDILKEQYETMYKYVDFMTNYTTTKYMFTGHHQHGDWLGLDAPEGSYLGSSRLDLIAQAFYAHSTKIVIEAGKILGKDVKKYENLYKNIKKKFLEVWKDEYKTQTEHVLALHFNLAKDVKKTAKSLADMIKENGNKLTTGFLGTPYLLHALSENGYTELAYSLLLQEEYPSWLFSVNMGATTIWEHWDGKKEDGTFWSADMNSFNHYAYGAVADWVYMVAAGIRRVKEAPGFKKIVIEPHPDKRLSHLKASIETRCGLVESKWTYEDEFIRYEIKTPSETEIIIGGKTHKVGPGEYMFIESI